MPLEERMALFELFSRLGEIDWLDGFCGGGGSSLGIHEIPGQRVRIAINHFKAAIDIHQANHQDTDHDLQNMSQVDPRIYPTTLCAWFSPSCTKHSIAQGRKKPIAPDDAAERSRATMWDVQRFAEVHHYRFIIVENVVEVRAWHAFRAWKMAMEDTGYCLHEVFLNAAHASQLGPAAHQSRDRWFCLMHPKGTRCPDTDRWVAPRAKCANCGTVRARQSWSVDKRTGLVKDAGKYKQQYRYACRNCGDAVRPLIRPARDQIDWSLPVPLIGERPKTADKPEGLAPKTIWRVRYGVTEFGASLVPVEGRDGKRPSSVDIPMRTVTTRNETALMVPPFMTELRGGSSKVRSLSEPLSTVCASGNHHGFTVPPQEPAPEDLYSAAGRDYIQRCGLRMIEPYEYARFQGFPDEYNWFPSELKRPLSRRVRVRLSGNAVPRPMARDLVGCALESMAT